LAFGDGAIVVTEQRTGGCSAGFPPPSGLSSIVANETETRFSPIRIS
jgi:hypothetical protein